ncbi:hypothetical protein ACLOJK_008696 [Asimina triloba]
MSTFVHFEFVFNKNDPRGDNKEEESVNDDQEFDEEDGSYASHEIGADFEFRAREEHNPDVGEAIHTAFKEQMFQHLDHMDASIVVLREEVASNRTT